MRTIRIDKFTKGEKMLYGVGLFSLIAVVFIQVFCGASIGNLNLSVEQLRGDIKIEEKKIESLNMKVSELTSFDNVKGVVKDMGLAYNNDNIIIISE
ncbi:MAG: hypothetical protein IJ565_01955 [Bacilli bacterium]|nr:hypothetical protein [Bacilli bacterium]